jgi:Flp pilus assembly pilin Flp
MHWPTQRSGGAATPNLMEVFQSVASALVATESRNRTDDLSVEDGQTMAEYAVVLAVLTPLVVAAFSLLGGRVSDQVAKVAHYINF